MPHPPPTPPHEPATSSGEDAPHLLLVEVAATDRFHRAVTFPYLLGRVRAAGVPASWWRFAVPAHAGAERPALLDDETLGGLVGKVRATRATHVLVGGGGVAGLAQWLAEALADVSVAREEELAGAAVGDNAAARWLGLDALPQAPPDFGFEPADDAAAETPPLPFVVLGPECTFNAPLARNPAFDGVDLSACVRQGGCSFCARPTDPRGRRPLTPVDPEDLAAQVAALERTLPSRPRDLARLAVRFVGEPALDGADQVARAVAAASLGPVDILLDGRADQLVRRRGVLEEACRALEGTPHRVHMALVGVESFARDELGRMNKGLTPQDNLDAARALMELERDFPGTFCFREHGGLSLITMTPWTTLDDLATNLHTVRGARLEGVVGKLLTGRVRLTPGLPMTALAERDGLLLEDGAGYQDAALDTATRNLYAPERPWRFADPRMEAVSRLLVRLGEPGLMGAGDLLRGPLTALREAAGRRPGAQGELEAAVAVVDAARHAGDGSLTPAALAHQATALLLPRQASRARRGAGAGDPVALALALARAGVKPVTKLEPLAHREAEALVRRLSGVAAVRVRQRRAPRRGWEAFVGVDGAVVARVAELTGRAETGAETGAGDDGAAQAEIGRLLGYPACCAEAFSRDLPSASRDHYSWLHVARRVATPGPVDALTHPWLGHVTQHYVPCSATCEETRRRSQTAQEVFEETFGAATARAHLERARHPWLVDLGGESRALEMVPTAAPVVTAESAVFQYEAGAGTGAAAAESAALALARRGDRLVLEGERTVVWGQGRKLGELTSRAFVWWYREALQAGWWGGLVALRGLTEARMAAASQPERPAGADTTAPWLEELRGVLGAALGPASREGTARWALRAQGSDAASLRVTAKTGARSAVEVALVVEDAGGPGGRALFTVGGWAFSHPPEAPLGTAAKRNLARRVGRALRSTLAHRSRGTPKEARGRRERRD